MYLGICECMYYIYASKCVLYLGMWIKIKYVICMWVYVNVCIIYMQVSMYISGYVDQVYVCNMYLDICSKSMYYIYASKYVLNLGMWITIYLCVCVSGIYVACIWVCISSMHVLCTWICGSGMYLTHTYVSFLCLWIGYLFNTHTRFFFVFVDWVCI
jgi:hypothetical protein